MAVTLTIVVPNITQVLTLYDRIKIYRAATVSGVYSEITVAGTRPVLDATTTIYTYTDTAGVSTNFYRVSYFNSVNSLESSQSSPQQGDEDPALDVISVEELKAQYLFGLQLTDDFGNALPDAFFQFYIKSAVSYLERILDIPLRPLAVVDERHDYYRHDFYKWIWLQLLKKPVLSVQEVSLVLPGNQTIITYDPLWLQLDRPSGQLMIVPGGGNSASVSLGLSTMWLPLTQGGANFIPDVFRVNYTAGFETGNIPFELRDLAGMLAAMGPLAILGDLLFGAGIAGNNISLDQLMTSTKTTKDPNNSAFGARLKMYDKLIQQRILQLRIYYQGIRTIVI